MRRPPSSPLFPYTTLFRSQVTAVPADLVDRELGGGLHQGWQGHGRSSSVRGQRPPLSGGHVFVRITGWHAGFFPPPGIDRKSTRLNSSHPSISYAVFCLAK